MCKLSSNQSRLGQSNSVQSILSFFKTLIACTALFLGCNAVIADNRAKERISWDNDLQGLDRLRFITNVFTRMRYCHADGRLELNTKSTPGIENAHLFPWFELTNNRYSGDIAFGHWASLMGKTSRKNVYALDTGCVWGRKLTALRLDDRKLFSVVSVDS